MSGGDADRDEADGQRNLRTPSSMRESTSRPSWSVPNSGLPEGGSRILFMSGLFGSHGEMAGASTATRPRARPTTTAPMHGELIAPECPPELTQLPVALSRWAAS